MARTPTAKPATDRQYDLLQSLTGKDWRPLDLTTAAASARIDALLKVRERLGTVAAREAGERAFDSQADAQRDDGEKGTEGEGQGSGEGQATEAPEQAPEPQRPSGNAVMADPLSDAIVATIKARRDEVLDGLELGTTRTTLRIVRPDLTHIDVTGQHQTFADLLLVVSQRDHVMLVGPAGTGKTSGAKQAALALGLAWTYWACNPRVTASALMGFMDANGQYVRTQFRDAYETGKLFILDEVDNAAPDLLTALNGAIENGTAAFPDGLVERHPDFVVVGTANTYGKGADRVYSGRQQLDGATLDRFMVLDWGYDQALERQLSVVDDWTDYVQAVRKVVEENAIREVVSMRATMKGGRYLRLGWSWGKCEETTLYRGWNRDSLAKVDVVRKRFAAKAAMYQGGAA
jgi:cobaltochelatase CobS